MVQMHENIARNITGTINEGSTVPETHHTSISPIVHSVNQGLEVKTEHGDFNTEEAPKEIGPRLAVMMVTSPTSQTSIGIGKGEVETFTNSARTKQKPTGGETRVKMALGRLKRATAMIRHKDSSEQDPGHFYMPKDAPLQNIYF